MEDNVRLLIKETSLQMDISLTVNVSANLSILYTIKITAVLRMVRRRRPWDVKGFAFHAKGFPCNRSFNSNLVGP